MSNIMTLGLFVAVATTACKFNSTSPRSIVKDIDTLDVNCVSQCVDSNAQLLLQCESIQVVETSRGPVSVCKTKHDYISPKNHLELVTVKANEPRDEQQICAAFEQKSCSGYSSTAGWREISSDSASEADAALARELQEHRYHHGGSIETYVTYIAGSAELSSEKGTLKDSGPVH